MPHNGLLIDYEYCSGCYTCEVACQAEHGFPLGQWGIKLLELGPWKIEGTDKFQYDFIPSPTNLCDLCAERTSKGKKPTCVHHCQAAVIEYGPVEELTKKIVKPYMVLFVPPHA
ncbi:MAG: hypothetical protein LBK67_13225 [Coriobacteriales bacterium]|jgi:anaerobic dimethyl sulfoxide reductase subunit B (iron-sulfur subunit)|nr:hypothetical protein [Coriobacteriales bacterium]